MPFSVPSQHVVYNQVDPSVRNSYTRPADIDDKTWKKVSEIQQHIDTVEILVVSVITSRSLSLCSRHAIIGLRRHFAYIFSRVSRETSCWQRQHQQHRAVQGYQRGLTIVWRPLREECDRVARGGRSRALSKARYFYVGTSTSTPLEQVLAFVCRRLVFENCFLAAYSETCTSS